MTLMIDDNDDDDDDDDDDGGGGGGDDDDDDDDLMMMMIMMIIKWSDHLMKEESCRTDESLACLERAMHGASQVRANLQSLVSP